MMNTLTTDINAHQYDMTRIYTYISFKIIIKLTLAKDLVRFI